MKRAALYVRVSTIEQKKHGLSVDSQIDALQRFCKDKGYVICDIYNDAGYSASKPYKTRPALQRMISDCKSNKVDVILFTKLDRFFRKVPDYYACMEQIGEVPWRAIWEDYETETSSGKFKVNIMLSIAQAEAERTGERIRAVKQYQKSLGIYIASTPPVGYIKKDNHIYKDPYKEAGVSEFFRLYLQRRPLKECLLAAQDKGVLIKRNSAHAILSNEVYMGNAQGNECESYITREQFEEIQKIKSERKRSPSISTNIYLFSGIIHCKSCGRVMCASSRSRESITRGKYKQIVYQCRNTVDSFYTVSCTGCSINEEILEKIILEEIGYAIDKFNSNIRSTYIDNEIESNKKRIVTLRSRLKRVGERYEDGDIGRDEYKAKREQILEEITSLSVITTPHEPIELPSNWRDMYDSLTIENKRSFWHGIIKDIKVYKNREVEIVL